MGGQVVEHYPLTGALTKETPTPKARAACALDIPRWPTSTIFCL
jgi:hypothetical protein